MSTDGPVSIFHNPACSKSRAALAVLEERGVEHTVVVYLETPPDRETLEGLASRLDGPPADLVRSDDPSFAANGFDRDSIATVDGAVSVLLDHPELMQRPVVVRSDRAVIGRPTAKVADLLA